MMRDAHEERPLIESTRPCAKAEQSESASAQAREGKDDQQCIPVLA